MANPGMLEELKAAFQDDRVWIDIGKIVGVDVLPDNSLVLCEVSILTKEEDYNIICKMSWDDISSGGGSIQLPNVDDLVLIALPDGDAEEAFIIKRLSSQSDTIPIDALTGNKVIRAQNFKKLHLQSDTEITLASSAILATEAIVLGNELKSLLALFMTEVATISTNVSTHFHLGNLALPTGPPLNAVAFVASAATITTLQTTRVDSDKILSGLVKTEGKIV